LSWFARFIKKSQKTTQSINKEDEALLAKYYENSVKKKIVNGELGRSMATINFINRISQDTAYRSKRKKLGSYDDIVYFKEKPSNRIRNVFLNTLKNPDYEQLMIYVVAEMEQLSFSRQPSVNLQTKNDGRGILSFGVMQNYEKYAMVNLLDHTANVVEKWVEVMENASEAFHDTEKIIILFGCLFHDYGKSIEALRKYGLDYESAKLGKYKHEEYSAIMIQKHAENFMDGYLMKNENSMKIIGRIINVVENHHNTDKFVLKDVDRLTKYVKAADYAARESEIIELNKAM